MMLLNGNSGEHSAYWYDFYHDYYSFSKESTDSIDRLLVRHYKSQNKFQNKYQSKIGTMKIITPEHFVPDSGNHYFYNDMNVFFGYIGLNKKREIIGTSEIYTYVAWIHPFNKRLINDFNTLIVNNNDKNINVFVTDTSVLEPQILYVKKIYKEPNDLQMEVIQKILEHWTDSSNYNTKVFLHGRSGIGKTYTAYGLKKTIETKFLNNVMLYDDFNPAIIGISIFKILSNARQDQPVIIVMNEIDIAYKKVFSGEQSFDPRGSYTKDKTSFNNMLDYISSVRYVIVIFTSEKSPSELMNDSHNYHSFMRKGRIDIFVEMKDKNLNCSLL